MEALIASAVVVWNDGENVQVAGRPFYPPFPLQPLAEVKKAVHAPADEEAEMKRWLMMTLNHASWAFDY